MLSSLSNFLIFSVIYNYLGIYKLIIGFFVVLTYFFDHFITIDVELDVL